MKSNLINNMDPKTLTSHINILRIIAQATVELVLARYAQLYGGICENVEISLSAKSKFDQTIEIELGSNDCHDRKCVVEVTMVSVSVEIGGRRMITTQYYTKSYVGCSNILE